GLRARVAANRDATLERFKSSAEASIAAADTRAATAEHNLAALQERLKPRRISAEQQAVLADWLRRSPTKGPVTVACVLGDQESEAYAEQIRLILAAAGFQTERMVARDVYDQDPIGLAMLVKGDADAPSYAGHIQHAFGVAGLPAEGLINPG